MFHLMAVHGADIGEIPYETDRLRFIGRGNTVTCQQAMGDASALSGALSGSEGSVLDPIVSIRYRVTLAAEETATVNIVSGIGETRDAALGLVEKYQDRRLRDRVFDLAWTHSNIFLRQINATEAAAQSWGDALRHPARIRLHRLRAHRVRHPLRGMGLRGHGRLNQVYGLEGEKRVRQITTALCYRICGMGSGGSAAQNDHACDHRN
jgi:hypothetical protein